MASKDFVVRKGLSVLDGDITGPSTWSIDTSSSGGSIRMKNGATEVGRFMSLGFQAIDGTASNPSIAFLNSYQTGLYRPAANQIGLTINGTGQMLLKDGALEPITDNDIDLGTASLKYKNSYFGLVDAENFKVNGGQGSDGQVLTSTGSGVAWEAAGSGGISNVVEDTSPQLGAALDTAGYNITSTSNQHISIVPHGTGDVQLETDTVEIGDSNANAKITTNGTGDLTLDTNNGTNSGSIVIEDGVDGDINITPNGIGKATVNYSSSLNSFALQVKANANNGTAFHAISPSTATNAIQTAASFATGITSGSRTTGFGTQVEFRIGEINYGGYVAGKIGAKMQDTGNANFDMFITPSGTGNLALGNFTLNADQSVGSGQDDYVMTYDHSAGTIGLEAAAGGSSVAGSDNQIQFNDGGSLSASSSFLFDTSNNNMQIGQGVNYPRLTLAGNNGFIYFKDNSNTPAYVASIGVNGGQFRIATGSGNTERLRIDPDGAWGLSEDNYGSSGQVLTSAGDSAPPTWTTISGGASALNGLTDVISNITNFTDSILISPDGAAPPHGTLNSATGNLGIGKDAMAAITSGDYNIAIGANALNDITTGGSNVAIGGWGALEKVTTQSGNVGIGGNAGRYITNGGNNTFVGNNAGTGNSGGVAASSNVGIGQDVMYAINGVANNNVGIGKYALRDGLTSGDDNIAIGESAGRNISSASELIFIGTEAGTANTTGARNIAIGGYAYNAADTESDNLAIGYDALGAAIDGGEKNIAIGNYTLDALTSGDYNTVLGYEAGTDTTTSGYSTFIGYRAGYRNTTQYQNTAFGARSLEGGSGTVTGEKNTAIGYSSLRSITTGTENTATGNLALYQVTEGDNNIALGFFSGQNITSGDNNVVIGGAEVPSATADSQLSISDGDGGTTWIQGNEAGVVVGALTPLFFERAAMDTNAIDFRVPTVQSSTANPNGYPMPFAGKVLAASFLFTGTIADDNNTNTIRIRKNGGSSGSDIQEFTFTGGDLLHPNANTLVKQGLTFAFSAGDILQVKRQDGATDLNNAQAILWVQYSL